MGAAEKNSRRKRTDIFPTEERQRLVLGGQPLDAMFCDEDNYGLEPAAAYFVHAAIASGVEATALIQTIEWLAEQDDLCFKGLDETNIQEYVRRAKVILSVRR